ncbi:MAG: hypothetical protein GY834_05145 [Bacteroidetes bacterium]|nr:hypothetical protein [Bacteroidota bacterium]
MKSNEDYLERRVQRYLMDGLNNAEIKLFKEELKSNSLLMDELEFQKNIEQAITDDELDEFKKRLDQFHKSVVNKHKSSCLGFSKLYLVAASLVILMSLLGISFYQNDNSKTQHIFNDFYERYESVRTTRGSSMSADVASYANGLQEYELANYEKAKTLLLIVIESEPENIAAKLFIGISYMELDCVDEAIKSFNTIIESKDTYYSQQAEWYKALCYLKLNDEQETIEQLDGIIERKGYYAENAGKLKVAIN